jgi:hypothetical protein
MSNSLIEYCINNPDAFISKEKIMRLTDDSKCTCERPDNNTCDFCDEQESKHILSEAKKRAEQLENIDSFSEYFIENTLHFYFNMSETKRMAGLLKIAFKEGAKWQEKQTTIN